MEFVEDMAVGLRKTRAEREERVQEEECQGVVHFGNCALGVTRVNQMGFASGA